jgi:hypothetical protein
MTVESITVETSHHARRVTDTKIVVKILQVCMSPAFLSSDRKSRRLRIWGQFKDHFRENKAHLRTWIHVSSAFKDLNSCVIWHVAVFYSAAYTTHNTQTSHTHTLVCWMNQSRHRNPHFQGILKVQCSAPEVRTHESQAVVSTHESARSRRMLTYADSCVCWRMLTYADCEHMSQRALELGLDSFPKFIAIRTPFPSLSLELFDRNYTALSVYSPNRRSE